MNKDTAAFEERLRGRFADVPVPERLAPENIGALLQKEKKNPSVYIVRRVSAMAAAFLVCALGALTLLLHTDAVGGAAADAAFIENGAVERAMYDSVPAEAPQAASTAAAYDAEDGTKEKDEDFDALVEAENARLEAARAKGEKR